MAEFVATTMEDVASELHGAGLVDESELGSALFHEVFKMRGNEFDEAAAK